MNLCASSKNAYVLVLVMLKLQFASINYINEIVTYIYINNQSLKLHMLYKFEMDF